jgi:hypothetical protein
MAQSNDPPITALFFYFQISDTSFYKSSSCENLVYFFFTKISSFFLIQMATNITWHQGSVSLEERQSLLKQKVNILIITWICMG